jgi:hypothetical protein
MFGEKDAALIHATGTASHYFNSPNDVRQVGASVAAVCAQNEGNLTHYSHAPSVNMFGEKRIMLTTKKSVANGADFLDILKDDTKDPGDISNIDYSKADKVLKRIVRTLDRDTWPICPGKRFTEKYISETWPTIDHQPAGSLEWAVQVVSNIIEYVRCKESEMELVDPILYRKATLDRLYDKGSKTTIANVSGDWYMGTTRAPVITEIGVWLSRTYYPNKPVGDPNYYRNGRFAVQYVLEIYLPPGAGGVMVDEGEIDLTKCGVSIAMVNAEMPVLPTGAAFPTQFSAPIKAGPPPGTPDSGAAYLDSGNTKMKEGTYRTIVCSVEALSVAAEAGFTKLHRPKKLALRASLSRVGVAALVKAPVYLNGNPADDTPSSFITYSVDPPPVTGETPLFDISSVSIVDPFVGKSASDWKQGASWNPGVAESPGNPAVPPTPGGNSFGRANSVGDPGALYPDPQQDTDEKGKIVHDSACLPAKKGSVRNPLGMMTSVAELGRVHTGICCWPDAGVPWRTLRLQPEKAGSNDFPDWAVLDLFCVPVRTSAPESCVVMPLQSLPTPDASLGGGINLNASLVPFSSAASGSIPSRKAPLEALLNGLMKDGTGIPLSQDERNRMADSIRNRTLASALGNEGRAYGSGLPSQVTMTPAQIVEYAGVADRGEASESVVRDIVDLASPRSGVFSIYSIGQTIRQDAQGKIQVRAETRNQRMIELINVNGQISVRPLFVRKLNP